MLKEFTTLLAFLLLNSEEIEEQKEEEHLEKISVLISIEPEHLQPWRHIQSSPEDRELQHKLLSCHSFAAPYPQDAALISLHENRAQLSQYIKASASQGKAKRTYVHTGQLSCTSGIKTENKRTLDCSWTCLQRRKACPSWCPALPVSQ